MSDMSNSLGTDTNVEKRPERALMDAMTKGFKCSCPKCGEGKLFNGFITAVDKCESCGEEMHHHRADDLPAYLVILIVGHVMVGAYMGVDRIWPLADWQHLAIWVPLTILSSLALLRPIKGAVIGLQWAYYMHGFGGEDDHIDLNPQKGDDS